MRRLSVLQIGKYYYPYRGGFESSLYTLVNELKRNMRVRVLASHVKSRTEVARQNGVTVVRLSNIGRIFSQPLMPLMPFWIRRFKSNIIHIHLPNPLAMVSYLAASPSTKLVVSYHNDVVRQRIPMFFFKPLLIKIMKRADAIVVTSGNLIESSPILQRFRHKCHIIPHGIDINKFQETPRLREESKMVRDNAGKPIILFVGRLVYYKGLKYLIRAMRDIDAKLFIAGEGPLGSRLKLLARLAGVSNKITCLGEVTDEMLAVYYHACDLFVLPSCAKSESFGLVILEAHAAGKPVISTDLPTGVTFTNLHQKTGLIVPPKNSSALANAINYLLGSEELRKAYGRNGRERIKLEFTKEIMAKKILTLYNTIINN